MRFRVVCPKLVAADLDAWAFIEAETGTGSERICQAVNEALERLAFSADEIGESRGEDERILIIDPISFIFQVFPASEQF